MGLPIGWVLGLLLGLALLYGCLVAFGAWRWSGATAALIARLDTTEIAPAAVRYSQADLSGLPAPVHRYFRAALTDDQRIVTGLNLTQSGTFNLGTATPSWKSFTARQRFQTARPGFVWDARIMMFPGVPVRVVDAFIAGEGLLRPTILGLFNMGAQQGKGEIARGELMRHLAESVWFPTALLPSQGVIWTAIDDNSANATMTDGPVSVTLLFRFGADGLVASIHSDSRAMQVGKATVLMPWECRLSNVHTQNGMRVPMTGEVLYLTPEGERPYFKGTIQSLAYRFATGVDGTRGSPSVIRPVFS